MLFQRRIFMVTRLKEMRRQPPKEEQVVQESKERLWKVQLSHGYYFGLVLDLWFETREQASQRFSPFTVYSPFQLVEAMNNERFTVTAIEKTKRALPATNDTVQGVRDSWRIAYDGEQVNSHMDQYYPAEAMTRQYRKGQLTTLDDFFRSLPVTPSDVADYLDDIAAKARAAAEEAERARLAEEEARRVEEAAALAALGARNNAEANAAEAAARAAREAATATAQQAQANAASAAAAAQQALNASTLERTRLAAAEAAAEAELAKIFPISFRAGLRASIRAKYGLTS